MMQAAEGKSVLWITHKLNGLERMDEIIVMHDGVAVERGTHAELLRQQGMYWKLYGLQEGHRQTCG